MTAEQHSSQPLAPNPAPAASHTPSSSPAPAKNGRKAVRNLLLGLVASVFTLLLVALIIITVGIYKFGWEGPAAMTVARVLPYPAATVNGKVVTYREYLDDVATVKRFFSKQLEKGETPDFTPPPEDEIRSGVLDRLIQTKVLEEQAVAYNVTVSQEDIDAEYGKLEGDEAQNQIAAEILDLYGWTADMFKQRVIRPYLMQQKLATAISNDDALTAEAQQRAKDVLDKVRGGADFAELAKEFSADPGSGPEGGELGWFEKGVMVPEFETAAFALEPDSVSDVVKTQFGYHIIKVHEIEKDEDGTVLRARASHILIGGPSITQFLETKVSEAKVKRYVKISAATE